MRPRRLEISGLNSFVEGQCIEFDKLSERGLFGIFGPTGSGKSTILDAMTIAMYGRIARDTREFINTQSDFAKISYEFEVGSSNNRKRYIVERGIKRDQKTGGYKTSIARLREVKEEGEEVLCEGAKEVTDSIIQILGLTCDDFTRSVVLPQGKFNDFLKLTGQDRRNMLERIFSLEKYGIRLIKRIRGVKGEKTNGLNQLLGELNRYQGVSQEAYDAIKAQLDNMILEEKNLRLEKLRLDEEYKKLKGIWERQQELKALRERKARLDEGLEEINTKKSRLRNAQNAQSVKPFIDGVRETKAKIGNNEIELERLSRLVDDIDTSLGTIQREYTSAKEKRDRETPVLIDREAKLNQAIELLVEIDRLNTDIEGLRRAYETNKNETAELVENVGKIIAIVDENTKKSEGIEQRINLIKTTPEYRERLQIAFDTEKEYIKAKRDLEEKNTRAVKLRENIEIKICDQQRIQDLALQLLSSLEQIHNGIRNLEETYPGDSGILLKKQGDLEALGRRLEELKDKSNREAELGPEVLEIAKSREQFEGRLEEIKSTIAGKRSGLDNIRLEIEKTRIANMAGVIAAGLRDGEACPVCGSIHHPSHAANAGEDSLANMQQLEEQLRVELENLTGKQVKVQEEVLRYRAEENTKKVELEKLEEALYGVDIKLVQEEYSGFKQKFAALKESIDRWNNDKREMDAQLIKIKDNKSNVDLEAARVEEVLKGERASLDTLEKEIELLGDTLKKVNVSYEAAKQELNLESFGKRLDEISRNEREISKLQDELKSLRADREECGKKKETIERDINELRMKRAEIEQSGKEKAAYIKNQENRVQELSEGRVPNEYLQMVRIQLESIQKQEENLRTKQEEVKKERQVLQDKKIAALESKATLGNLLNEQLSRLGEALRENNFDDDETAMTCLIPRDMMSTLERDIKSYEDEYTYLKRNIDNIACQIEGNPVEEIYYREIQSHLEEVNEQLNQSAMDIGAKQQILSDMQRHIEIVNELTRQKKTLEHSLDLLDDLDKLVQGNRFVEFVATSQLKYIALEASKRLKEITRGRYALELDPTGNFIMRDDFNGGTRRATDTLSGGETFLTSLALALALSSQIQLKGSAPLEFFFLDEGFGTLDSELLEVVLGSLERLHSDKLCVGIISHVEELKNRVPVKLIVTPAKQGGEGSRVQIEYS